MSDHAIEVSSRLRIESGELWAVIASLEGINDELRPLLRMTLPRELRGRQLDEIGPGLIGRSWLLLGGLIPVEYDRIGLAEIVAGRGFSERSTMGTMRSWRHDRHIESIDGGSLLRDRVGFELRAPLAALPGSRGLATAITRRLFEYRHRRLRRAHGELG